MKVLLAPLLLTALLVPHGSHAADRNIPPIRETFTQMHPGPVAGKTIREIVPPESVKLIALVENRGMGSPLTKEFKPGWGSDQLLQRAFESSAKAREWSMSATESTLARYAIVTKQGSLFLLDVLGDRIRNVSVTAVILRGDGFGCRLDIGQDQKKPNQAIDSDKK